MNIADSLRVHWPIIIPINGMDRNGTPINKKIATNRLILRI